MLWLIILCNIKVTEDVTGYTSKINKTFQVSNLIALISSIREGSLPL